MKQIAKTLGTVHTHTQVFYKINKRNIGVSKNTLLFWVLLGAILLMGIGYASINTITGEIEGTVIANVQEDVFITNVEYVSDVDADLNISEIKNYKGTLMQSTIGLSSTNSSSEITYKVTVYNNSAKSYPFLEVLYDGETGEFYDNQNIIFEISGFSVGDTINAYETKKIYITFKYKDGIVPENTVLNSYINFRIVEPNRLVLAGNVASTGNYLGSTIVKNEIETISFKLDNKEPEGTVASFDASEKQDESIIGYYTDTDENGLYELTFESDEIIAANKNAQYLFQNLTNLKEIEFDNFSTFGVTNMFFMFYGDSGLTKLNVSGFDTSKVTDMQYMFFGCINLTSLDVTNFNTSNVTNMKHMFENLSMITTLDVSKFDTSKVTEIASMFYGMSLITELNVSNFDTSNCTRMDGMFQNMTNLTELKWSDKFNTEKVTNMDNMFCNCKKLESLDLSNFNTSNVSNMRTMFYDCNSLESLDLSNFNTSKVTYMGSMFNNCNSLTSLNCSSFDTSNVTNMYYMFCNCKSLKNLDCSGFDTSKVTDMSCMFYECNSLTSLDVSNFDTRNVTNMNRMFAHTNINILDLKGFNTSKVTDMTKMFNDISNLTTIYVTEFNPETSIGWTISNVNASSEMFWNSKEIVGGNGTTYNSSYLDATYARIDTEETPGYLTNILDKTEI